MSRTAVIRAMRWSGAVGLLAVFIALPAGAHARATRVPIDVTSPLSGTTALPECLPADLVGTLSGTERTVGTIVFTDTVAHAQATTTLDYRVDFPDGSYVVGTSTEHFTFASKADTPLVSTTTLVEPRTVYDAAGNPIGTALLHFHGHITVFDANGDGDFTPDEVVTNYDQFFWTCGTGPPTRG
jgi:hypothetical protein